MDESLPYVPDQPQKDGDVTSQHLGYLARYSQSTASLVIKRYRINKARAYHGSSATCVEWPSFARVPSVWRVPVPSLPHWWWCVTLHAWLASRPGMSSHGGDISGVRVSMSGSLGGRHVCSLDMLCMESKVSCFIFIVRLKRLRL